MRRIALLGLFLLLTGCGTDFGKFLGDTHTFNSGPNMPPGDSENLRRVSGYDSTQQPLLPEPGNIWPPPAGPMPTLMDLEKQTDQNAPAAPATGYGAVPPAVPSGGVGAVAPMATPKAATIPSVRPSTVQTPNGTAVTTGGGPGYSTTTGPAGAGQSIVVPNGNGTSTVIHADGTVETIPTPK
jgi:hypothetical protein